LSSGWHLCRPHPQGRKAGRSSSYAANEVRLDHQSQDCEGARPHSSAEFARARRRGDRMRRREFITLIGAAAAALPLAARGQQRAFPVVGLLSSRSPAVDTPLIAVIRQSLNETGFVEGQNVALDYRWADGQYDRLAGLATDLVRQQVAV